MDLLFTFHVMGIGLLLGLAIGWAMSARTRWSAYKSVSSQVDGCGTLLGSGPSRTSGLLARSCRNLRSGQKSGLRPEQSRNATVARGCGVPSAGSEASTKVTASLADDLGVKSMPRVALVMPAKSEGEHLMSNWRSQVLSSYGGHIQSFIVVGSERDPGYSAAQRLRESLQADEADVSIIVAGPTSTCSQKIHNQLTGLAAVPEDTDYIFFVDDDIELAPSTISCFVEEMETKPEVFLVTGYPLDVPSDTLASYATAAFHLPLSIVFSFHGRTSFVWGGCMFFRASDLRRDVHGLVTALRSGGYSDDMTVAAAAASSESVVVCPGTALFLQRLPSRTTLADTWNYLRRQIFACTTYSSLLNLLINQAVMWLHVILSTTLVLSMARSLTVAASFLACNLHSSLCPSFVDIKVTCGHLLALSICATSLWEAQTWGISLCCLLGGIDTTSKRFQAMESTTNPFYVWTGLFILNALYPLCTVVTVLNPLISWSGISYRRRLGKIKVLGENTTMDQDAVP